MDQNLTQNVETLFTNMENFTQKEGLIGKPVVQGDKTFLPVVSVTLGYGGGNSPSKTQSGSTSGMGSTAGTNTSSGSALGLGAKITTEAIIIIDKGNVSMMPLSTSGNLSQLINKIPEIMNNMNSNNSGSNGQSQ